ncbi:outer membrane beta-barrel protein [Leisingera daeponensis]|uniref:Outer membrane beta-barrel protein n=1 Tax=Leisingera daeponensis TaxID=405746 RepID=A0ABS7N9R2_9RHOB|nr:outer membrane beta-barrel protein [Leisingera daeponensis]MBY6137944.1 outer membrane beta-barrel protein [Leisingera daeponensis]
MPELFAFRRASARILLAALALLAAAALARAEGSWQWQLTPFVLAPSIDSTTELGRSGGDVEIDAGDAFDQLQAGGMLQFEGVHSSNLGFRLRYSILDADADGATEMGPASVRYDQNLGEAVLTYRFARGRNRFEVFGGLRHWEVDVTAAVPGGTLRRGADWTDPIAGFRWERRLSDDISLALEADIGLGGGSDKSWSAMGGVIYDRWERASIYVMYRGLGVDYQEGIRGTGSFFRHDAVTHSLLAGVGFRF